MSLKAFHIIFVTAATLLAFWFGWWELRDYFAAGNNQSLFFGIGSLLAGLALIWYGKVVLRKMKHINYL